MRPTMTKKQMMEIIERAKARLDQSIIAFKRGRKTTMEIRKALEKTKAHIAKLKKRTL
jgi:exonuclease VII small subunit